ncbi:hypothetical protein [Homoserinimonas aerilata]|uniref:hypothetical protein n=1 Tax=Homoserinimonas aerilata TaxID=1162970 RepID=UPI00163953F7|nr:hypothetical protein [Homoserinimonas aerilata]
MAEDQVRSWLRDKKRKARGRDQLNATDWDGPGVHELGPGAILTVASLSDDRDGSHRQLLRFDETNAMGRWIVTVVASSLPNARGDKQVLHVELDKFGATVEEALAAAKPPRLVMHLLDSATVLDNETPLTSAPIIVRADNIEDVFDAIHDDRRMVSVVVAVPPGGVSDEVWQRTVGQLTRESVGVATAFAISESVVDVFAARLPESHSVPRGSVRTFAPRVNVGDPADAIRHRVLGANSFARAIKNGRVGGPLLTVHAQLARRRMVEAELPSDVRRAADLLIREEARISREAQVGRMATTAQQEHNSAPNVAAKQPKAAVVLRDWLRQRFSTMLQRWLQIDQVTPDAVDALDQFIAASADGYQVAREQIDGLLEARVRLNDEIQQLRDQVEEAELTASIESESARSSTREARILRSRLRDAERHADALVEPELQAFETPSDIEELLLRLDPDVSDSPVVSRVIFTGSESDAMEIAKRDPFGRVVNKMWDYVLVLHDYAQTRENGYQGSLHHYLSDPEITSRKCPVHRHAAGESEAVTTNAKMMSERIFTVPVAVHPDGKVAMLAHFKPTHSDTFAPRMHYFDDTANTGKIYVGYMGRHLTNSKTN